MKNERINVLLCSPFGNTGGIAQWTTHIFHYYNAMQPAKVELTLLPVSRSAFISETTGLFQRFAGGIKDYSCIIKKVKNEIRTHKFDVVHLTSSASLSLLKDLVILRFLKREKVKSVIHFRFGRIPELFRNPNWETKLLKNVVAEADKVIVIDKSSYDTLLKQGYENVLLLPNPVSSKIVPLLQQYHGTERKTRQILFAGHIVSNKGVYELIEACKVIPNVKLRMLGLMPAGFDRNEFLMQAQSSDENQWVEMLGSVPFEEVIKEMLSCSVFVLPTYTEGFPNVILESMACGCPIVTTDVGAIPEMLDIEHGFNHGICVKPRQVEELRAAIIKMLDDREYAMQCGQNAQRRVNEMYSMPKVWERLVEIWENA